MKQILSASVLALAIHGFFFSLAFNLSGSISFDRSRPRALTMTLASIPIKTAPKPSLQKPTPILKKNTIVKKKRIKPKQKRIIKTPPKKTARIPAQSKKRQLPKTVRENTEEKAESFSDFKQSESKALLEAAKQTASIPTSYGMIFEAKPIYRSNPSPKYPRIARIRGYQGHVLLDVLVDRDGNVQDLKVFKSSGYPLLDRAAASSVKQWLFEPGRVGEKKVAMWVRVPIRFELK